MFNVSALAPNHPKVITIYSSHTYILGDNHYLKLEVIRGGKLMRLRFIGRHLMMKGEYAEAVLSGVKRATIRLGIVKPKYREVMLHAGGKPIAIIEIERVFHKKVKELTDKDAQLDGFKNREELLKALRKAYNGLSEDDWVTILEFKLIKEVKLEGNMQSLTPVEIARIALRYNVLSDEEERKLLEEVVRCGSLRKAAIKLYGTIERRWVIRRVLKKAIRLLKEKGVL